MKNFFTKLKVGRGHNNSFVKNIWLTENVTVAYVIPWYHSLKHKPTDNFIF